ncbi:MAG: 3' terminal RNA ribose 2'-O-methyltransferase Hen1 [Gordonia polyisoprenivorans]|uniref:3' terminal RNA ribose 2'-O-methyltransferase Hen1 n=1 Tax=Gordonia polyisoprenivorans TaxID=84595 RepID=UPI00047DCF49|nr:3' terminal RNA ribose 2'-O-methyltransferase Hen1 [Gordonia polyisoprenivorans]
MLMTLEVRGGPDGPATDVGYLLHKHPDRVQRFPTSQGVATVFYPIADDDRCRVAMHVDGIGIRPTRDSGTSRYVTAVPYEASTRMVVALGKVFGDALAGRCHQRPELVDRTWDLTVRAAAVPCPGGPDNVSAEDLFEPLGWTVEMTREALVPVEWGSSDHGVLTVRGSFRVVDALRHLAVLVPVLTRDKHYFVDDAEIEKLVRLGDSWLPAHPHAAAITRAYLKNLPGLAERAITMVSGADAPAAGITDTRKRLSHNRTEEVLGLLSASGARSVLDVGCGEGRLLAELAARTPIPRLAGVDVAADALHRAARRLELVRQVELWQSSLMYADPRCSGYDAVVLMEVIEHIDRGRLPVAMASVFDDMAPATVVVTTPNREFNARYGLAAGELRHPDHRFEFDRTEFADWCAEVSAEFDYTHVRGGIGDRDAEAGSPTQYAVFTRTDPARSTEGVTP